MRLKILGKKSGLAKKKPLKVVLIAVLILAILGGTTYIVAKKTNLFNKKSLVQQLTAMVTKGSIEQTVEGSGSIKSAVRKEVSSKVTTTIQTINYKVGDEVKKGDTLFELDDTDALVDIENTKNSVDEAKLNLQDVQESIASLTVKAPFSGYITDLSVKEDDTAGGNATIATITDTSKLKITLPFSGSNVHKITVGQKATVNISELMQSVEGAVSYIGNDSYALNGVQVYDVEITLNNPGTIKNGLTANAEISVGSDSYTSIESSTLDYISSKVIRNSSGGTVKSVNIKKNQYVKAGEVLVVLENEALSKSLKTSELKVQNLESQLEIQQKKLTYYALSAPCNGTILSQDVAIGDTVSPGSTLAVVADMDTLEFSISIDELDISDIKVGQTVTVTADAIPDTTKNPLSGKVSEISMEGTSSNGVTTYPVTITLDKSDKLKTGMNVNGEIFIASKEDILKVPVEAIKTIDDESYVYVKSNNTNQTGKGTMNNGNMPQPPSGAPGSNNQQNGTSGSQGSSASNNNQPSQNSAGGNSGSSSANSGSNAGGSKNTNESTNTSGSKNTDGTGNSTTGSANGQMQGPPPQGDQSGATASTGKASSGSSDSYYANAVLVKVETGISDDTYIEITSGLTEGQVVILPQLSSDSESSDSTTQQKNMNGGGMMGGGMDGGSGGPPAGGGGPGGN